MGFISQCFMKIKLSGVNSLTVARYAAGVSLDFIGFSLRSNDQQSLKPKQILEILTWVVGPKIILEIDDNHLHDLDEFQNMFQPYAFELISSQNHPKFWTKNEKYIASPSDGIFYELSNPGEISSLKKGEGIHLYAPQESETGILNFDSFDRLIAEIRIADQ